MTTQVLKAHVSINVRNVGRSIDFYRRMLGIEPSKVRTGYAKFDVQNPPLNLALNEVPTLTGAGALSHLGLQVGSTGDVLAIRIRWSEAGLVTRDEMKTRLLLCDAGQDLGPRSRRQRVGGVRGAQGQSAGERGCLVVLHHDGVEQAGRLLYVASNQ